MPTDSRLVLGGHSFIKQLGNDPKPSPTIAAEIVSACLSAGITWFDTTYQPERVALGRAMDTLGRRKEATIIAWNFFTPFRDADEVSGHAPYQPLHLKQMLDELQTDRIDLLIVHGVDDAAANRKQHDLARTWLAEGKVKALGTWAPSEKTLKRQDPMYESFTAMVLPMNVTTPANQATFELAKQNGWTTLATSPFVRGWELDKRLKDAAGGIAKPMLADRMLRFALDTPGVDRLIVSMRKPEYVAANVKSASAGPLKRFEREALVGNEY